MRSRRTGAGCDFTYVPAVRTPVIFQERPAAAPGAHLCPPPG